MAKGYEYPEEDEGRTSKFNSAMFKMRRLHEILSLLNSINTNLTAYNDDYGIWNYELHFKLCNSLFQETESKLTSEERIKGNQYIEALKHLLHKYPPHRIIKDKDKQRVKLNSDRMEILEKWLFKYESLVRSFVDIHGMDTAYNDEDLEGL